jgi:hypothetical protein
MLCLRKYGSRVLVAFMDEGNQDKSCIFFEGNKADSRAVVEYRSRPDSICRRLTTLRSAGQCPGPADATSPGQTAMETPIGEAAERTCRSIERWTGSIEPLIKSLMILLQIQRPFRQMRRPTRIEPSIGFSLVGMERMTLANQFEMRGRR